MSGFGAGSGERQGKEDKRGRMSKGSSSSGINDPLDWFNLYISNLH